MKKRYLILVGLIGFLLFLYIKGDPFVGSTNLENENLAGFSLFQQADKLLLENAFGKLTNDATSIGHGGNLTFDNPPYYAVVQVNKDNQVTKLSIGCQNQASNRRLVTSRNIGSGSTLSDIQEAYGNEYYKKTLRNFMGSGDGLFITYVDREQNIAIEFEFNDSPYDNKKELQLIRIELRKQIDKGLGNRLL